MRIMIPAATVLALMTGSAAFAQSTPPATTMPPAAAPSAPATVAPGTAASMTDAEAKAWISKNVYSTDNKHVGDVAAIQRDASGKVTAIDADVGGFLGLGTTRVRLQPAQFSLAGDRVLLKMGSDHVKDLPKIEK